MAVLLNPRHELFAQELAKGKNASESYITAGFKPNQGNASVLKAKQIILNRIAEIQMEHAAIAAKATEIAAESLSIDRAWIMGRLKENAERAMQAEAVMVGGEPTGEYRYEGSVANRALELLGKEIGMFIDRSENRTTLVDISEEPQSPQEWAAEHVTAH